MKKTPCIADELMDNKVSFFDEVNTVKDKYVLDWLGDE